MQTSAWDLVHWERGQAFTEASYGRGLQIANPKTGQSWSPVQGIAELSYPGCLAR